MAACEHCERELDRRVVTLVIAKKPHKFCDDRCEQRWLLAALARMRTFALRIYCNPRKARALAKTALFTDAPP